MSNLIKRGAVTPHRRAGVCVRAHVVCILHSRLPNLMVTLIFTLIYTHF